MSNLGPSPAVREYRHGGSGRILPPVRLPHRGSRLGSDHDPVRAQRHVGRGLGGGIRSDERGRPDVPPQAGRVPHPLLGPVRAVGIDAHGPNVADRERAMSGFRRGLGMATMPPTATRCGSLPRVSSRSRASWTTSPRRFLGVRSNDALYPIHLRFRRHRDARAPPLRRRRRCEAARLVAEDGWSGCSVPPPVTARRRISRTWRARDRRRPANVTGIARAPHDC